MVRVLGDDPSTPEVMRGRYRRCASQQGNALDSLLRLGLGSQRLSQLVERLLHWQWPDGGWNCDRNPQAHTSSVHETLLPMRGLWHYGLDHRDVESQQAARRAAAAFLGRRLSKRRPAGPV